MIDGLPGRRGPARSRNTFIASVVAGVTLIGLLILVVAHRDARFPTAQSCPPGSVVNVALGTHVAPATAAGESDLLGCFYQQGSDAQAVSVSFATRNGADPCRKRPRIGVSGHEGCNVTGTRGTKATGISLLVETGDLQDQFSSDIGGVPFVRLERLAVKVLAETPPHLQAPA